MIYAKNAIHWRQFPSIKILFFLIPGIIIGFNFPITESKLNVLFTIILFSLAYLSKQKLKSKNKLLSNVFYSIILLFTGIYLANNTIETKSKIPTEDNFIGIVLSQEIKQNSNQLTLEIKYTKTENGRIKKIKHKVIAFLSDKKKAFNLGDYIFINIPMSEIKNPENPNAFHYKEYLKKKSIYYQFYLNDTDYILLNKTQYSFYFFIKTIQKKLVNLINENFKSQNQSGLISAMILGYRSGMDTETKGNFSTSGLTHILAVSGLHIGIIFFFLFQLIGRWKLNDTSKIIQYFIIFTFIWAYIFITGSPPSAIRAGILCSLLIGAKLINRKGSIFNHLGVAAILLLVYHPELIFDIGFQLSFAAVWGIIYFQDSIFNFYKPKTKIGFYLWKLTSTSIAAQLSTAPICLFTFHQFPIYFWLSGLIGLPLAPFILGLGILFLITIQLVPSVAFVFHFILDKVTHFLLSSVDIIASLPGTNFGKEISLNSLDYIFIGILFTTLIFFKETKNKNWIIISFLSAFILINHSLNKEEDTIITFYSDRKSIYVDVFSPAGNFHLSNATKDQAEKAQRYFLSPWRINHRVKSRSIKTIHLEETQYQESLIYDKKVGILPALRFLIIDQKEGKSSIKVDIAFISGRSIYPDDLDLRHIKLLILDKKLSAHQARTWEQWAKELKIPTCNMYKEGAVWVSLNNREITIQSMEHTFKL